MTILPALWSYVGVVEVKVEEVILGGRFSSQEKVLLPGLITCWNYKVMGSQRRYLEGLSNDRDDADDEYWLIRDAVDTVDIYLDYIQSLTL